MVSTAPFLNVPYGGYLHNQIPTEDEELTHVGPRTPGGEWLRRYWHPVFAVDELKDLPVALRIMCEDLVIFRDGSGQIGLLELHCSHREGRRWSSGRSKSGASAAAIMRGSTTPMVRSWRLPVSRRTAR